MAISKVVYSLAAISMFGAAIAQEETRVTIEVMSDDDSHEAVSIVVDGDEMGFNLHDMQEGENQAIVDENGRTILVTRNADGYTFDVGGKTIKMPLISADHENMIALHGEHDGHHEVKVIKKVEVVSD